MDEADIFDEVDKEESGRLEEKYSSSSI